MVLKPYCSERNELKMRFCSFEPGRKRGFLEANYYNLFPKNHILVSVPIVARKPSLFGRVSYHTLSFKALKNRSGIVPAKAKCII